MLKKWGGGRAGNTDPFSKEWWKCRRPIDHFCEYVGVLKWIKSYGTIAWFETLAWQIIDQEIQFISICADRRTLESRWVRCEVWSEKTSIKKLTISSTTRYQLDESPVRKKTYFQTLTKSSSPLSSASSSIFITSTSLQKSKSFSSSSSSPKSKHSWRSRGGLFFWSVPSSIFFSPTDSDWSASWLEAVKSSREMWVGQPEGERPFREKFSGIKNVYQKSKCHLSCLCS